MKRIKDRKSRNPAIVPSQSERLKVRSYGSFPLNGATAPKRTSVFAEPLARRNFIAIGKMKAKAKHFLRRQRCISCGSRNDLPTKRT
jgi:hypothetical protein